VGWAGAGRWISPILRKIRFTLTKCADVLQSCRQGVTKGYPDTVRKLSFGLIGFAACLLVYILFVLWASRIPFSLMDLDDSGFVSPKEFYESLNLGYRQAIGNDQNCTEIYFLKDGLERKIVCGAR
jgi:hypothetical protein